MKLNRTLIRSDAGASLLEVLVALFVLSIGLLGLAGLQTISLRFNHQSYERTQATLLTSYIVDRMRANPAGVRLNSYLLTTATNVPPTYSTDCRTTACTNPADLATYDIAMWIREITADRMLPQGKAQITLAGGGAPAGVHIIRVYWQENNVQMQQDLTVDLP